MRCLKLQLGPIGSGIFRTENNDCPTTLINRFQNLVRDRVADDEVPRVDAAGVGLVLQLVPEDVLYEVLVVVGVGDEDVVVKVPVLREAIPHPTKGVEPEQKVLFLSQDHGKETGDKEKE